MIYLDYASNTLVDPAVLESFCLTERQFIGNPSANHEAGRLALSEMERITESIAGMMGAKPSEIIYTSGATEANNLALKGLARAYRHKGKHILSTCLEHPSIGGVLTALQEQGYEVDLIDIRPDGRVDMRHLKELLRRDTIIVSVCWTDSELGATQPIGEIAEILREYPACRFHVDATQAVGKLPVHFDGIDCMTFAPHKFHGMNGCGILLKHEKIVRCKGRCVPFSVGQPGSMRIRQISLFGFGDAIPVCICGESR